MALVVGTTVVATSSLHPDVASAAVADDDWLGVVNAYRSMSGLDPVTANATWSAQAKDHSCYMLLNGISHDEIDGKPGYTPGGDTAGNSGNVAVSSAIGATARDHIDLWMTGPFHAIGILRHNLRSSGFGLCSRDDTPTSWHSGATLDVIRGIDQDVARPSTPILFPGSGATVPLTSFVTEFPDPLAMCGWTGEAGLPLIALMPNTVSTANATLVGPDGPIETCVLHSDNVGDPTARAILGGDNAILVVPRDVLHEGQYTATVDSDGGDATWSFRTDRDAPLSIPSPQPPDTPDTRATGDDARFDAVEPFRLVDSRNGQGADRLIAGTTTRIRVGDASVAAVSANFVAVHPESNGYLTAYPCSAARPTVSTLNYRQDSVVANQAIVPLVGGELCVYTRATTDLVVDVNGYYRSSTDGDRFVATDPARLLDTRDAARLAAGRETRLRVAGTSPGAPAGASAVALNVTAIDADQSGWLRVAACGADSGPISSLNYRGLEVRPNSVVIPVGPNGDVCLTSLRTVDVTVDLTGYFVSDPGLDYQPLVPIRLFDSRSPFASLNTKTAGSRLGTGQVLRVEVAGKRGIPADARAVSVNLAATDPASSTYITAFPCGPRPPTANLNLSPDQGTAANGAMVKLSADGDLCIFTRRAVHVIVDVNGVWR